MTPSFPTYRPWKGGNHLQVHPHLFCKKNIHLRKVSTGYSDGDQIAAHLLVLQRPLLLRELYNLSVYEHTLSLAHRIHV